MACNMDRVDRVLCGMVLITLCVVGMYFWADSVYRGRCGMDSPHLSIETARLDYKNGSNIGEWTLGISMRNPNKCTAINYKVLNAFITLEAAGVCIYTQTGAVKPPIQLPLSNISALVNPKGWPMIDNQAAGTNYINVTLSSPFSFELHPRIKLLPLDTTIPSSELFFVCRNVPVSFNRRGGIKTGAPIQCEPAPNDYLDHLLVYLEGCAYRFYY